MSTDTPTYLPTPADATRVIVTDHATGAAWGGRVHDGLIHDASGIVDPSDIGVRFTVRPMGPHGYSQPAVGNGCRVCGVWLDCHPSPATA